MKGKIKFIDYEAFWWLQDGDSTKVDRFLNVVFKLKIANPNFAWSSNA